MMNCLRLVGLIALGSSCFHWSLSQQPTAELILHGGHILTVDDRFSVAQAVAISGREFQAVGLDETVLKLKGPNTRVLDLKGRTVIPGLIDTHGHYHNYAERVYGTSLTPAQKQAYPIDWRGVRNKDDVLNQIEAYLTKHQFPPGQWVYFVHEELRARAVGSANSQFKILYNDLNRWELAKVSPENPIALSLGIPNFNGFLLNDLAMRLLFEEHGDFIRLYGRFWVDASATPDGHLEPPASRLVFKYLPSPAPETVAPIYKKYLDELAASGVTTVSSRMPMYSVDAFRWLESRGELTLRVGYGREWDFGTVTDLQDGMKALKDEVTSGNDKLWVTSSAPTAVDGAGTRACTDQERLSSYSVLDDWWPTGQCHYDIEYRGSQGRSAPIRGNYYRDWTFAMAREGIRYANTHVAGDRGVSLLLDLFSQIQQQNSLSTEGWAMDHCFMVNPEDFGRAARLGITFSCTPKYIESGANMARSYGDRVANTFLVPVKSLLDAGVKVVFESDRDAFVWTEIELLMTRMDTAGNVWGPQEKLDRETVLKMITRWAAEYVLKSDKLGSIETGKLADLVVLDRDYMAIPEDEMEEMRPRMTLMDGRIVYIHPQLQHEYGLRPGTAVLETYDTLRLRRPMGFQ